MLWANFKQILEATPYERTALQPLLPLTLKNNPSKDKQDMWDTAGEARRNS